MDVVAALLPMLGMFALFGALLFVAFRATDGSARRDSERPPEE